MTRSNALLCILAVLALIVVAAPRSGPENPPSIPAVLPVGPQAQSGAPSQVQSLPAVVPDSGPVTVATAAPHETGGIGDPASYFKPTPKPRLVTHDGITGDATYYCRPGISRCTKGYPFGMYAAAGPAVRALLGPDWRGREVIVQDAIGNVAVVRVIDVCACGGHHVIDLYWEAFSGIVNPVTVTVP